MRSATGMLALFLASCATPSVESPLELANTSWRVLAINGQSTPTTGDYSMRFEDDRVAVRFGCNHMGGSYTLAGSRLVVGDVHSTLIGCPEPAATFERQGGAVLGQPMAIALTSNRLMLRNTAGSLALEQVP